MYFHVFINKNHGSNGKEAEIKFKYISVRDLLKPVWLSGWERKIFAETFVFSESHVMFPEFLIHYPVTL